MNRLWTSLRRSSSSGRSLVVVVVVFLAGLLCLFRLLCLFVLIIKLALTLVVPASDRLTPSITIPVNSSGRVTLLTPSLGYRGYLLFMSLYPQYLLFSVCLIVSPEFPIGLGPTAISQPINLGQLMVIESIVSDLSGPSCLL